MAVSQYIGDYYVGEDGKWVETTGGDKVYVVELADGKNDTVLVSMMKLLPKKSLHC